MASDQFESPYFAAIDLGSNSFHMLIARFGDDKIEVVDREKEMVQIARGMQEDGTLSDEAFTRAIECLHRFAERLRDIPSSQIRAVGTKTLRSARNSKALLKAAENTLGAPIQIISGYEEARLVYTGFSHSVSSDGAKRLVIDIGGGSTEFVIGQDYNPKLMESLALGCVSFSQNFIFKYGGVNEKSMKKAYLAACSELEDIRKNYLAEGWNITFGTSGTMKAVAEILAPTDGGAIITLESLEQLIDQTIEKGELPTDQVPKLRREVLPAGLAILKAIFHQLKIKKLHVADATLKEGLIYDTLGRFSDHDSRDQTVTKLKQQYSVDEQQADRVAKTARSFWRSISPAAANLTGVSRTKILNWASQLHEVGLSISHSGYHHHGYYILRHSDLAGFGRYEQYILANLVRSHRKKLSTVKIEGLDDQAYQAFLPLLMCLRISARLHRRREDLDHCPRLSLEKGVYQLHFKDQWLQQNPLTHAGLEQEANYFKNVGISLTLT